MSNGTKTYQFKPALLKAKQAYFVTKTHIERTNKDGNVTIVYFKDINNIRYADTSAREYKFRRLDIVYGEAEKLSISISLPLTSNVYNDKHLSSFYLLMHDIARRLHSARPELTITIGETSRINWIYFTIGALTVLSAFGIFLGAYLSGVSDQKLINTIFPILTMVGFGTYICFMAKPWVSRPEISMHKFKLLIENLQEG